MIIKRTVTVLPFFVSGICISTCSQQHVSFGCKVSKECERVYTLVAHGNANTHFIGKMGGKCEFAVKLYFLLFFGGYIRDGNYVGAVLSAKDKR